MLAATLPYGLGEAPESFCSRLAKNCGRETATDFCKDFGITFRGAITGAPRALETLADLGGVSYPTLVDHAFQKQDDATYVHRGQILTKPILRRHDVMVCPVCIDEDMRSAGGSVAPFRRTDWLLWPIRTCAIHGVELVDACGGDDFAALSYEKRYDFARRIQPFLLSAKQLAVTPRLRDASEFERYLIRRLARSPAEGHWLDAMPFYAVVRACEMIGAVETHGIDLSLISLTKDDWHQAGEIGFHIAASADGVRQFLERKKGIPARTTGGKGMRVLFGRFYDWLSDTLEDPGYTQLRAVVREVALENVAFAPGDILLGEPLEKRHRHSLYTLSASTGIFAARLRNLLHAGGFIRDEDLDKTADQTLVVADERLDDFLAKLSEIRTLVEAAMYINATRTQIELLCENGFIQSLGKKPFGKNSGHQGKRAFTKDSLDKFLDGLLIDATKYGIPDRKMCDIATAARSCLCRSVDVIQLVLDRRLKTVQRHPSVRGYPSVLVDRDEVWSILRAGGGAL